MKLADIEQIDVLTRPAGNKRTIADGTYLGETTNAEYVERDSQYSDDGKHVVINIKVEVINHQGEVIDLYIAPSYSWSKRGNMMKILEKLEVLPAPGEFIHLDELIGIPVQIIVENVNKDGETYSNIVSIKRVKSNNSQYVSNRQPNTKKSVVPKQSKSEERVLKKRFPTKYEDEMLEDDFSSDTNDDFDELDDIDELEDFDVPNDIFDED